MAVFVHTNLPNLPSFSFTRSSSPGFRTRSSLRIPISFCCSMSSSSGDLQHNNWKKNLLDFPYLSPSHRDLMLHLISAIDSRLGPNLLPSSLTPDVSSFHNPSSSSHGALDIRYGHSKSKVDFILASWLHSALPSGSSLDITTLFAFLNTTTDAPHLSLEFIRSSPASLILILDAFPRRDLILCPDYLQAFYENTHLDKHRQRLEQAMGPNLRPYVSWNLYIRSLLSPTAIAVSIESEELDEMLGGEVGDVVKEVVSLWVEECGCGGRGFEGGDEREMDVLKRRDYLIKTKAIEVDLSSSLPRLFGPDVANKVILAIQKAFGVADR